MSDLADSNTRRQHANAIIDQAIARLLAHDMSAFADLWAPDGVIEFPFAATGYPERVDGREEIRSYLSGYSDRLDVQSIAAQTRHQTEDPDTVIVEFEVAGEVVAGRRPYRMRYVAVITVSPAGISLYRDYWSPLAVAEIMETHPDDLLASITGKQQ